jgi:hypothetical protein
MFAAAAACVVPNAARADEPFDQITVWHPDSTTTIWRIDRPNVTGYHTPYPRIKFHPGDQITVHAGGCVQTGGIGRTWKSYTNPLGANSPPYYYGTIYIPAVIPPVDNNYQHIGGHLNVPLRVPDVLPPLIKEDELFLNLGYEDDNYSDNGYDKHDDGNYDQCKNQGPAFVVLRVVSKPAHAVEMTPWSKPFDLTWRVDNIDPNALPVNPFWAHQIDPKGPFDGNPAKQLADFQKSCAPAFSWNYGHHGVDVNTSVLASSCTSQEPTADFDQSAAVEPGPRSYCHPEPFPGHLEWALATYTGAIYWQEWSGLWPNDNDLNFQLLPTGNAGLTVLNSSTLGLEGVPLGLEMAKDETLDKFRAPFWQEFSKNVDQGLLHSTNDSAVAALLDGKFAVVTGLIGIDGVHGGWSEIHPVMAMAICTSGCTFGPAGPGEAPVIYGADQTWAFFLQNYGSGGGCSSHEHTWPGLSDGKSPNPWYYLSLPWHPGATGLSATSQEVWGSDQMKISPPERWHDWTYIGIQLPAPSAQSGTSVDGQITLRYTVPPDARRMAAVTPPKSVSGHEDEGGEWKDVLERVKEPARRAQIDELMRSSPAPIRATPRRHTVRVEVVRNAEAAESLAAITLERARQLTRDRPYEDEAWQQAKNDFFTKFVRIVPLSPPTVVTPGPEPKAPAAPQE